MHKEVQTNSSDIVEWVARPFDQEDVEISRSFRQGTLDCRDILAVEKYQREGIIGALVLPNSLVQYGIGWFRTVPIGFEGQYVGDPDAEGDPLKPKEKDDFSLKLLASIFIAANSNQEFCEAGGLVDLLQCDLKIPKALIIKKNPIESKDLPSSSSNTKPKRAPSPLHQRETPPKKHQLSASPRVQDRDESSPPSSNTGNFTPQNGSRATSEITEVQDKEPVSDSTTLPLEVHNEKATPSNRAETPISIQETLPDSDQEFWSVLRNQELNPKQVQLTTELETSYWSDKYTVQSDFALENFKKYAVHFFIASRTPTDLSLDKSIDLSGSAEDIAARMLGLIRSLCQNKKSLHHDKKVVFNQALYLVGLYLAGKNEAEFAEFLAKHDLKKGSGISSVTRIASVSLLVARIWDKKAPIARMGNLHANFFKLHNQLGKVGGSQMEAAIHHLQQKYPPFP
ncbi:hypothetical protein DSO57_1035423 [Entomophthora muscae]|uniref:Uncharacterized protein n=1 Tax=Entomophthora muscae TaxID=34485 RepID=A0ACC2TLN6_9FUNG|nr:hypothetical protein DSO57_1035423 [Entomophthora muscae]